MNIDYENTKDMYEIIKATAKYKDRMEIPVQTEHTSEIPTSHVLQAYNDARLFDLDPNLLTALEKTDYTSADQSMLKMPYPSIILNINRDFTGQPLSKEIAEKRVGSNYAPFVLENSNYKVLSALLMEVKNNYIDNDNPVLGDDDQPLENPIAIFAFIYDKEKDAIRDLYQVIGLGEEDWSNPETVNQYIANIVNNFLLFLNQPEVELRTRQRSQKNRKRRKDKGKIPLPHDATVKVSGEMKQYLDKLGETDITHNHRYWVRGHWRTLKDRDTYGDRVGEQIWVKPHIRGEGILVEKDYEAENG